jgi:hypothetical protein
MAIHGLAATSLTLTNADTGYSFTPPYGASNILVTVSNGGANTWRWALTQAGVAASTAPVFAVPTLGAFVFTGPYDGNTAIWFASGSGGTVLAISYDTLVQPGGG